MMSVELGKTYRHVASHRVVRVDYVGTQTAVATTLEPGKSSGEVDDEVVIRLFEAGWQEYTPPKVHTEELYVQIREENDFILRTEPTERDIAKVRFSYAEGGSLTVTVL